MVHSVCTHMCKNTHIIRSTITLSKEKFLADSHTQCRERVSEIVCAVFVSPSSKSEFNFSRLFKRHTLFDTFKTPKWLSHIETDGVTGICRNIYLSFLFLLLSINHFGLYIFIEEKRLFVRRWNCGILIFSKRWVRLDLQKMMWQIIGEWRFFSLLKSQKTVNSFFRQQLQKTQSYALELLPMFFAICR